MLQDYISEMGPIGVNVSEMLDKAELLTTLHTFPGVAYRYQGDALLDYLDRCMQDILKKVLMNPDHRVIAHGQFLVEHVELRVSRTSFKVSVWAVIDK